MQISAFSEEHEHIAHCIQGGIKREVNTYLLNDKTLSTGDYVLVHVGYAIQIIDDDDAMQRQALFKEMNSEKMTKGDKSDA
ncbi:MAG: HypC/HybG/HupF family hydrogenase formation chaperone [Gammaproteobacteria bacterium]|nr:HypC/HybG/HupF family hydrogenase formation chaperone [Gammaproteobacteria bacterium]